MVVVLQGSWWWCCRGCGGNFIDVIVVECPYNISKQKKITYTTNSHKNLKLFQEGETAVSFPALASGVRRGGR